jgi:hypothetical protein
VGLLGPPIHNMGPCSRPGEECPETIRAQSYVVNSAVPSTVGRLGGEGFWVVDYGGGAGRPPFWRTPVWPRKGLGPLTFEIKPL